MCTNNCFLQLLSVLFSFIACILFLFTSRVSTFVLSLSFVIQTLYHKMWRLKTKLNGKGNFMVNGPLVSCWIFYFKPFTTGNIYKYLYCSKIKTLDINAENKRMSHFSNFCTIHVESHKTIENKINQSAFKLNFCAAVRCHARGMS